MQVQVNGAPLGDYALAGRTAGPVDRITPPFSLDGSPGTVRLSTPEGCRSPHADPLDVLLGTSDARCLGLAFSEVRLFPALDRPLRFGDQLELVGYEVTPGPGPDRERVREPVLAGSGPAAA